MASLSLDAEGRVRTEPEKVGLIMDDIPMKLRHGSKYETLLFIQHILQHVDVKNLLACGRMPELPPSPNYPMGFSGIVDFPRYPDHSCCPRNSDPSGIIQVEYRTFD